MLDSAGQLVGYAVGRSQVARLMAGHWVVFEVTGRGFDATKQYFLFFSTPDCSGTVYVDDTTLFRPAAITGDGRFAFMGGDVVVDLQVHATSISNDPSVCWPLTAARVMPGRPAQLIEMSSLGLVPPFSVAP